MGLARLQVMNALARQRQQTILDQVRRDGGVRIAELAGLLGVSDMTVRRDINELADRGLVARVHGGATVAEAPHTSHEPSFAAKLGEQSQEKVLIAQLAADLIPSGSSVGLSGGTTTLAVAEQLTTRDDLTVVTNSLPVADMLHARSRPDRSVVLTGGSRTPSDALVGPVAEQSLASLHVDTAVLGAYGLSEEAGCTTPNLVEAATNQALIRSAARVVVVADHTKLHLRGLASFAALESVDLLITDGAVPTDDRERLASMVGRLVVAE